MKLNPGRPAVEKDREIVSALTSVFRRPDYPRYVVETGTYHGTGTTRMVLEAIGEARASCVVYTIEADLKNYIQAIHNLRPFPHVRVMHGLSVDRAGAAHFVENDEMLREHEKYPDILFDAHDPIPFYLKELNAEIFGGVEQGENNVFNCLLMRLRGTNPLFVLDSCGGIGWYEFQEVCRHMGNEHFYMWAHDINHVKHHRTFQHVRTDPNWILLGHTEEWMLAEWRGYEDKR